MHSGDGHQRGAVIDRTHITPVHIEHSVQFPLPVDILRPGVAY